MTDTQQPYYLVIGLGKSGLSMAKFLVSKGEQVIATDIDTASGCHEAELNGLGIKTQIGFHDQETFNNAAYLVPSPGIPLTVSYIQTGLKNGANLTCELDIFQKYNSLPIIAITGTNGKTTTTTLIGELLKQSGFTPFVGGNIGTPLVDLLMDKAGFDCVVAEISSFQLDMAENFSPDVGLLLNISEDHLDRYENIKEYEESKWSLFKNQTSKQTSVINQTIKDAQKRSEQLKSSVLYFSSEKTDLSSCHAAINAGQIRINLPTANYELSADHKQLPGIHNKENMAAAILACLTIGAKIEDIAKGLKQFTNLPHRIEFVKTINGISFYNDSKATNTDAVIRALQTFNKNIILILGGRVKGTDFSLLLNDIKTSCKAIIAMGESRQEIFDTLNSTCPTTRVDNMKEAVYMAFKLACTKDTVLLSPACASFDMYESYTKRGEDFSNIVNRLEAA